MHDHEIPKAYDPQAWEDALYRKWEESGLFNPDTCLEQGITTNDAPTFSIVLPPPNVTGTLHAGHAAMLAIEDAVVRYHRMRGDRTLWIPGTDHAAIATQSKVEKILMEEEGKTRHDLGRASFLKRVEQFAQESHDTIINQTKKLGSSLDWSREAYTLDHDRSLAVRTAFKRMYDDGLIYRGARIVNWDPKLQTTVSDDEIEWKTETIPFYYFQYGPFVIGTSRPETKCGDKYVVMHPDDERYLDYTHGQTITLEWINGPVTATIIKDEAIDREFGSGVMTITPWHDTTDFDIAERHQLEKEQVIGYDGTMLPVAGEAFAGLSIMEARQKIVERLTDKGLVVKIEDGYVHNIAINSRGGGIIEPQIMRQWFIDVNKPFSRNGQTTSLKHLMQDAVREGGIVILPERFRKIYFHWIDNLRDWCISRQIWFGHQIPVWYRGDEVFCDIHAPEGEGWAQDPDTLDTWFSSGLWTFSTLGWPNEQAPDLIHYHPTTLLETGYDILFFWVARMILMTEYLLDTHPFQTVYLHGLVRDGEGRKMSKSLGNTIDPLDVSREYGADALRLSLIAGSTPGNDLKLSDEKIVSMRNFTNKLWNLARYVSTQTTATAPAGKHSLADQWIIEQTSEIKKRITAHLDKYELSLAVEELRAFTWNDFADWYVEIHKIEKHDAVLKQVFDTILKLWHPFMPFVTEAIHQTLKLDPSEYLMIAPWPSASPTNETSAPSLFDDLRTLITRIRNLRTVYRIDPSIPLTITLESSTDMSANVPLIERLARVSITDTCNGTVAKIIISEHLAANVSLEGVVDVAKEEARLTTELAALEQYTQSLKTKLANPAFADRAPQQVVTQTQSLLSDTTAKQAELSAWLTTLRTR